MSKTPDPPTVLVVDDIEDNRAVLRYFLTKKYECRVIEAADGQEALKLALRESPALILMDIGLPRDDGLVVVEQMRKRRRLRSVPIIAVTAYDSPAHRLEAQKAGITEYVTKPPHPDEFGKLVGKFLQATV